MLRRCWDLRNIPCEASSVSDQDEYRRDRSDIQVRLTRRREGAKKTNADGLGQQYNLGG